MRSAAATVADRFHTDAEPDTLVSLAIPGKEEFLLSSPCQSVRLSGFLSLLFDTTKTTTTMPVHAISHYDPSASYLKRLMTTALEPLHILQLLTSSSVRKIYRYSA